MSDDYLWDGSGEPDPEIQRLESTLGQLRHHGGTPEFPMPQPESKGRWLFRVQQPLPLPAVAACIAILTITVAAFWFNRSKPAPVVSSEWNVSSVEGSPRLSGKALNAPLGAENLAETANLGVGQVLETDNASRASIRAEETGEIQVEPGTRLRLVKSFGRNRLTLERGTIQATIWAAPGKFVVETPSALAVDLGCIYTLKVDDSGDGLLHTTLGWVGFKLKDRESFIPAGATCATRKKTGPGTPYFEDAAEAFRAAIALLDRTDSKTDSRTAALEIVLSQSRPRDALTLWHLLPRVSVSDRGLVYDRLAQLVPPPAQVTREGILGLDSQMLDLWWNEFGFGDVSLWRHWERSWPQEKF